MGLKEFYETRRFKMRGSRLSLAYMYDTATSDRRMALTDWTTISGIPIMISCIASYLMPWYIIIPVISIIWLLMTHLMISLNHIALEDECEMHDISALCAQAATYNNNNKMSRR